ncbi:MAG: carboxymuconolactone decarboxylase family protein [Betaproteobacteria bacterium]|nr:carboxymuconolactone decarboxylase family protein [Betaproteobacteria bacterium]
MARVPLLDEHASPDVAALIAKIRDARGGRLLNLYRLLLHNPAVAAAWLEFNNAVRYQTELDESARELAILRVAILNGADYILRIHGSRYAGKAGLTQEQLAALPAWRDSALFSRSERALLAYVDAMTRDVEVPDDVFNGLRGHFSERQVVELTVLIGAYNMHTRVLKALRVDPEPASGENN